MKSGEFIIEAIADIPTDVISRLGKLLSKPLRDRLEYVAAHPTFYALTDLFDEIVANKTYAKSPRRDQAIELLFPYVVQNLDEIIKTTKAEGYEFPFPLILKLFKHDVDNDAVAEVVDHNKDRLLAILHALIEKTSKSEYNVGRSAKEHLILEIIRRLKNNFIDWPELDVLYKQHFNTRYNNMLNAPKDKWGTSTVYNVIRDMTENTLTLHDLDTALASRLQGMKDILLNRHFLNFKWDSISYSINSIKEWYRMLKKVGFTWPELSSFETMPLEQQLTKLKTPIIKDLLKLFKDNEAPGSASKRIAELKHAGMPWPELDIMTQSLSNDKPVVESNRPRDIAHDAKVVKNKFANGDYADAIRYMGEYGLTYAAAPKELQQLINSRRIHIIKELLDIAKHNPDVWRVHRLMSLVKLVELNWPEIDIIFNSVEHAYNNNYL